MKIRSNTEDVVESFRILFPPLPCLSEKKHESIPYLGMVKPEVLSVQQIRCSPCTPRMNSFENMHILFYYT